MSDPSIGQASEAQATSAPLWLPSPRERALLFDTARLTALYEGELLDVPPPDELQRICRLVARQLHVPMAALTVVDTDRQFFLAAVGLPAEVAERRQTGLAGSLCKHTLFDGASLVIPDLAATPQYAGYEAVVQMGIRSYVGAPIVSCRGHAIGALCVMAPAARAWTADEVAIVEEFAGIARDLIDARLARAHCRAEHAEKLDILTRITEGFVTLDRTWRVRFANSAAAALARCTAAEAVGRTLWELIPPLEGSSTGAWLRERMELPGVHELEWKGVANPGWYEMRTVVSPQGMSLFLRDISPRKRVELALAESEARYRELATVAPVGIFETDSAGECTFVNQRWSELTGQAPRDAAGGGWTEHLHPEDRTKVAAEWRASVAEQREFRCDYRFVHADGTVRWVWGRATALRDASGAVTGYIGTIADVTDLKAVEAQLREVNQRFEHALAGSDIGLWDWHVPSGRVHFNDHVAGMLGYSAKEFPGHVDEWARRVHPDDHADVMDKLTAHLEGRTPFYRCTHRLRAKNGSWRWILDAGAVVERDANGQALRVIGTHVDVTESKATEERFRMLFEKSAVPKLLIDEHGVLDCNDATVRALRCRDKYEIIGRPLQAFLPRRQPDGAHSLEAVIGHVAVAANLGEHRFEFTLRRADGMSLPLEITLARATFEGRQVFLTTWHDLTQQLEEERVLREAKEAAELANRTKSEFLARMSHELRSPLNSIIGFSRLLRRTQGEDASPTDARYLERIQANGVHLLGVINDILDLSRIEAGRVTVERSRADVAALLRGAAQQLEGQVPSEGLQLRVVGCTTPSWLETDHQKLRQVVINLVANAIKFTPAGEVVAELQLADDGTPRAIEVRDTGIGIAPDRLQAIFEPFEQGDNGTARRFEGTGLGLAISRELCDLLGYELTVTSTPGRGSTFRVAFAPGR